MVSDGPEERLEGPLREWHCQKEINFLTRATSLVPPAGHFTQTNQRFAEGFRFPS